MTGILLLLALTALPASAHAAADDARLVDAARRNEAAAVRASSIRGVGYTPNTKVAAAVAVNATPVAASEVTELSSDAFSRNITFTTRR